MLGTIKIYEVIKEFEYLGTEVEVGDLLFYDEEKNKYILSKNKYESDEHKTYESQTDLFLNATDVENNSLYFKVMSQPIEEGDKDEPKEDSNIRTKEEILKRKEEVEIAINALENNESIVASLDSKELDNLIYSLRKEYWVLDWVLNIN